MFKVECEGCKAPYQIDERRVPATGLKMRCPKCGVSFVIHQPGGEEQAALPAVAAPKSPGAKLPDHGAIGPRGAPPAPPIADLPAALAGRAPGRPPPAPPRVAAPGV